MTSSGKNCLNIRTNTSPKFHQNSSSCSGEEVENVTKLRTGSRTSRYDNNKNRNGIQMFKLYLKYDSVVSKVYFTLRKVYLGTWTCLDLIPPHFGLELAFLLKTKVFFHVCRFISYFCTLDLLQLLSRFYV